MQVDMQFQPNARTSKDFELFGVAWRPNEIWYVMWENVCFRQAPLICLATSGLDSTRTLRMKNSCRLRGFDATTAAKVPGSSPATNQLQPKGPTGKTAKGTTSATTGLLVVASSTGKSATTGQVSRTSPPATSSTTACTSAKAFSASTSAKPRARVVKATPTVGARRTAKPTSSRSIAPLPYRLIQRCAS